MDEPVDAFAQHAELLQNLPGPLQVALFLGALALLPAGLVCLTGFTRIVIVLSFVRRAVTSQDLPSNQVLLGLSLFLTWLVMDASAVCSALYGASRVALASSLTAFLIALSTASTCPATSAASASRRFSF